MRIVRDKEKVKWAGEAQ